MSGAINQNADTVLKAALRREAVAAGFVTARVAARCHPAGGGPLAGVRRGWTARRHALDGRDASAARLAQGAVARGPLGHHAGHELCAGQRSAGCVGPAGPGGDLVLRARQGLPRRRQERPQARGTLVGGRNRRRSEGVRRYGAGDGKTAGGGVRFGLAGQAHQSRVAGARLVAVSGSDLYDAAARTGCASGGSLR